MTTGRVEIVTGPYQGMISFNGIALAGTGHNGGSRNRIVVSGNQAPAWFIDALPTLVGRSIEVRITGIAGRKMAFCVPTARSLSDLLAQADGIDAADAARYVTHADTAREACIEAQSAFAASRGWIVIETTPDDGRHYTETATMAMGEDNVTHEILGGADAADWARFQTLDGSAEKAAARLCRVLASYQKSRFAVPA